MRALEPVLALIFVAEEVEVVVVVSLLGNGRVRVLDERSIRDCGNDHPLLGSVPVRAGIGVGIDDCLPAIEREGSLFLFIALGHVDAVLLVVCGVGWAMGTRISRI